MICPGCSGVVGRDCFNPHECEWISHDMQMRAMQQQQQPEPCQGCHYITGQMLACLGICKGMRSEADAEARAEVWASLPHIYAERPDGAA